MLLLEELAPTTDASFDRVRTMYGTEDGAAATATVHDATEAGRARVGLGTTERGGQTGNLTFMTPLS